MSLVAVARTNRGRPGESARQVVCHARQTRTCPEARRTSPAQVGANLFVASAILHPTSMLDRLCFTWTGLRSMDRPSVDVRTASILRIGCPHTESAIPRLAHACQQKATVSSQADEKSSHTSKYDASMSHKTAATSLSRRLVNCKRIGQTRLSIGTNDKFSGPV